VKSNIDTSRATDINFSCLLCLRRQRLQKIDISNTVAFLGYFDYICDCYQFFLLVVITKGRKNLSQSYCIDFKVILLYLKNNPAYELGY